MSMIPWGACASLHPVVQRAETLLSQADGACTALRAIQSPGNASLVQLHQVLIDGRTYIQREYDHLSNRYGSNKAAQGDQTARVEFWMICSNVDETITKPLESLTQHLQHHHCSHHDHCHYCHEYHHHHSHHHGHHHHGWGLLFIGEPPHHHHHHNHSHNHNQLAMYESRFQDMMNRWGTIKDNISSCFDSLEDRLKDKKSDETKKSDGNDTKKNDSVADAVHNIIDVANKVDENVHLLEHADEKIRMIGKHPRPPTRSHSFSSSSSSSSDVLDPRCLGH